MNPKHRLLAEGRRCFEYCTDDDEIWGKGRTFLLESYLKRLRAIGA